jgi:hypothetical protein
MKKALYLIICLVAVALCARSVRAEQTVVQNFGMPTTVHGTVSATDCNNRGGPQVTLEGIISLGGVQVQLIFQNNAKGTHTATVTYKTNVVLVALNESITIPKQPVRGGVGGNPFIWVQFTDENGNALTDEIFLGRCVQGLSISPSFLSEVIAAATIDVDGCENSPGPTITVGGTLILSGVNARFIFRNNVNGPHEAQAEAQVSLIAHGSAITIPKQPVLGGAGGNPLISVQFLQGDGSPIGEPTLLGRCNKL